MEIKFKNKHIFFVLDTLWDNIQLDYKFKYQINQLVTENSDDDYEQTIDISPDMLILIYQYATVQPEGVSASMNKEINLALGSQLMPLAGAGNEEAIATLTKIGQIDAVNTQTKLNKIQKGKEKILS